MAAIRNPYPHSLFSVPLGRSVDALEVVDGLSDEVADAVTRSGIFERGYTAVIPEVSEPEEPVAEVETAEAVAEPEAEEAGAEDAKTEERAEEPEVEKRPAGRRTSKRGAAEVEETTQDEDEVETR